MSDYLWDRSGPADPEVERLERTLSVLRLGAPRVRRWPIAAAAAVLLAVAVWQAVPRPTGWEVAGAARQVRRGEILRTGVSNSLSLQADAFGQVEVAPDSEVRVLARERLHLRRGTIHALIWAPPRQFVVDTSSARAVDLGCQYTLSVDAAGDGRVEVETGWVAFEFRGVESFIPAGAACVTRRRGGPGVPYYLDASDAFRRAVDQGDLGAVLAQARPRDALTLWHLLGRVPEAQRGAVFDRFAKLVRLPPEVSRAGALARDRRTLDLCWNALDLRDTEWWRGWRRSWR